MLTARNEALEMTTVHDENTVFNLCKVESCVLWDACFDIFCSLNDSDYLPEKNFYN